MAYVGGLGSPGSVNQLSPPATDALLASPARPRQQPAGAAGALSPGGALSGATLPAGAGGLERTVAMPTPGVAGLTLGTLRAGHGHGGAALFPWMMGTTTPSLGAP